MKLKKTAVLKALKGVKPQRIKRHMVMIGDTPYPMKHAYAVVTGEAAPDFNTREARKAFKKAGFQTYAKT